MDPGGEVEYVESMQHPPEQRGTFVVRSEGGCPQFPKGNREEKQAVLAAVLVCCLHITATDSSAVGREREREEEREDGMRPLEQRGTNGLKERKEEAVAAASSLQTWA